MTLESLTEHIGRQLNASAWVQITQERITRFAEASGDMQWIHVDEERARAESPYAATIAHGFLMLSMLSQLSREAIDVKDCAMRLNYGVNRVRFPAAVAAGSYVRALFSVVAVKPFDGGADITLGATMELRGSTKPCCVAEWVLRYYSRVTVPGSSA